MKLTVLRKQFLPWVLLIILGFALPVQAIHLRRVVPYQTDTFQVAPGAKIVVGSNQAASLADLRIGDRVSLAYAQQNGVLLAHRIADGVPHTTPRAHNTNSPATGSPPKPHTQAAKDLFHVHGVVRAINLQTGTMTVTHRVQ